MSKHPNIETFLQRMANVPVGYGEGMFLGKRYGTTATVSKDGKRRKLFARELGGNDIISFNLYILDGGNPRLKPCEMSSDKVIDFVLGYEPFDDALI